jgi:hypothetical protein
MASGGNGFRQQAHSPACVRYVRSNIPLPRGLPARRERGLTTRCTATAGVPCTLDDFDLLNFSFPLLHRLWVSLIRYKCLKHQIAAQTKKKLADTKKIIPANVNINSVSWFDN